MNGSTPFNIRKAKAQEKEKVEKTEKSEKVEKDLMVGDVSHRAFSFRPSMKVDLRSLSHRDRISFVTTGDYPSARRGAKND